MDERELESGVEHAADALNAFIDRELKQCALDERNLALIGFSQGAMMALHVGVRRKIAPAGVLGFSGALAGAAKLKNEMKSKPPILLVHGDRDDVIPLPAMFMASEALAAAGHGAQWHISYGVPHSIGPDGLELGGDFLSMALNPRAGARVARAPQGAGEVTPLS